MMYLDTSILAATYIPETKSDKIQTFLAGADKVAISSLVEVELHSAISRRVRMKELSPEDGRQVLSLFQLHIKQGVFQMLPIMRREYELARDWLGSFQTSLRTLDALHLAVAFSNQLQFITADSTLEKSAKKIGIKTQYF
ncbi:MAG: type II toxin-antitoxin system VapC family toxin [Planctomycetia bacterium]|jgi:predicted nucleic acid-binding protein